MDTKSSKIQRKIEQLVEIIAITAEVTDKEIRKFEEKMLQNKQAISELKQQYELQELRTCHLTKYAHKYRI